jgi:formylglycine-generating enzyme required for sulfatase activity
MQAAAAPPSGPANDAGEPRDWLGYQRYADALWARIVHNFALDADARSVAAALKKGDGRDLPTGDPLVVGVYGEWGVGKSRLLELMYQLAARQNAEECLQRARDPQAYANSPALRLTVPVWFHPWKYEHEPHLAVPLLMHLAEAVQRTLGQTASFDEQVRRLLQDRQQDVEAIAGQLKQVAETFQAAAKVAHKVAGNGLVKTTASLAAGYFGFGAVAERALGWVEQTAAKFLPAEDGGAKPADEKPGLLARWRGKGGEVLAQATPEASADGRYYYNVHRYLSELTRIDKATAKRLGHETLRHDIQLNFVVFVDDLDRCLPEKAVEVLEVIKTILNVDSFAFVIALDDEVIERGISYRYREYRFQNAKPEMPITGFEYLEKIVHLPFRLPQLTRAEAVKFLFKQEERLLAPTASDPLAAAVTPVRLWFLPDPSTGELQPSPLVHLLLDSFDAFVPRKLGRTLELMHQFQQVFTARGTPIQPAPAGFSATGSTADARMVLCCVLLQLFAPEIFRLLRRRPELFGHWMRAYLVQDTARNPVFVWQKTAGDQLMTLEVSDSDLYRWVALGSQAGTLLQTPPPGQAIGPVEPMPFSAQRDQWSEYLGRALLSASDRYSVEQVRLPLAAALSGFREMQRHAFAPLRLGGAMAYATGWTAGAVPLLRDYLNLFSDQLLAMAAALPAVSTVPVPPPVVPIPVPNEPPAPGVGREAISASPVVSAPSPVAQATQAAAPTPRPVRQINPGQFFELVSSADAATRAALPERLGLQRGELIETRSVIGLAATLRNTHDLDPQRMIEALAVLAPFIDVASAEQARPWPTYPPPRLTSMSPEDCVEACLPYSTLAAYRLDRPLELRPVFDTLRPILRDIVDGEPLPLPLRSMAADQLGAIGDPRFDFDPGLAWLPRRRAQVQPSDDEPPRESRPEDEPVPGFVRITARGPATEGDIAAQVSDIFMGRTLVTVRQFEAFIDDDGYADDSLWDADGLAWRMGAFDAPLTATSGSGTVILRAADRKVLPWRWSEQQLTPTRPVVGVCWFEARAYAAWLSRRLRDQLESAGLSSHRVRLPTEVEWERAARAKNLEQADARPWWHYTPVGAQGLSVWANFDVSRLGHSTAVGLFPPSPLGIFDLAGNVWEWMDNLTPKGDGVGRRIETAAPIRYKEERIAPQAGVALRGGSWQGSMDDTLLSARASRQPWEHDDTIGLRVALVPPPPSSAA